MAGDGTPSNASKQNMKQGRGLTRKDLWKTVGHGPDDSTHPEVEDQKERDSVKKAGRPSKAKPLPESSWATVGRTADHEDTG